MITLLTLYQCDNSILYNLSSHLHTVIMSWGKIPTRVKRSARFVFDVVFYSPLRARAWALKPCAFYLALGLVPFIWIRRARRALDLLPRGGADLACGGARLIHLLFPRDEELTRARVCLVFTQLKYFNILSVFILFHNCFWPTKNWNIKYISILI